MAVSNCGLQSAGIHEFTLCAGVDVDVCEKMTYECVCGSLAMSEGGLVQYIK